MPGETRRTFLKAVPTAAPALAALGVTAGRVSAHEATTGGRRVVGGSPSPNFSRAVVFDRVVFVAGVVGTKPDSREVVGADFESQCRQALDNLKASVEAAGSSMDKVLKCTCFLTDVADFATMNKIYVTYFPADPPARSTLVVKELVVPGAKLEIDCVTCLA